MSEITVDITADLLVPCHLNAFVARGADGLHKDLSPNLDNLKKYHGLGAYIEKDIQANNNTDFYEHKPGVHLQWVMPKCFRHGTHNEDKDQLDFLLAPNRWLVVRSDNNADLKGWVIESDFIDSSAKQDYNWIQVSEITGANNQTTKQFIPVKTGRFKKLDEWAEANSTGMFLTVIGPADPSFAAAYLHSQKVFGFYDNLENADDKGPFAYNIFGWFSDPAKDPLFGLQNPDAFNKKLGELSWAVNGTITTIPNKILCHAFIHSVNCKNPGSEIPLLSNVELGIGNTVSEALAAILSNKIGGDQLGVSQNLLSVFQYKKLIDNGMRENGLDLLQKEMHKRSFNLVNGGTVWVIEEKEKELPKMGDDKQTQSLYTEPFSKTISDGLLSLNSKQSDYDKNLAELAGYQEQLYAALYKQSYAPKDNYIQQLPDEDYNGICGDKGSIAKEITDCINNINALSTKLNQLKKKTTGNAGEIKWPDSYTGDIPDTYKTLIAALKIDPGMKNYEAMEVPAAKFYVSSEPSLVINGLAPSPQYINKYSLKDNPGSGNQTIEKEAIKCRMSKNLANQIKVVYKNDNFQVVGAEEIMPLKKITDLSSNTNNRALLSRVSKLVQESALFDPAMANSITLLVSKRANITDKGDRSSLNKSITSLIKYFYNNANNFLHDDVSQACLPEIFSVAEWKQPWIPLFIEWGIQWHSTETHGAGTDYLSNWAFGDPLNNTDYVLTSDPVADPPVEYYGRTILSSDMVNKTGELNKKLGDGGTNNFFDTLAPMSQNLSGLFSQLITRYHGIQLPVLDQDLSFNDNNRFLNGNYPWRPMPDGNSFFPLRSGAFNFSMLRIIDAFGQVLEIIPASGINGQTKAPIDRIYVASGFPSQQKKGLRNFILPPRFIQPARIRFEWLSAKFDGRITDSDPATNPVCGWLLQNKLDNSIMVFDTDGIEIGELTQINDAIELVPPPGGSNSKLENDRLTFLLNSITQSPYFFNTVATQMDEVKAKVQSNSSRQLFSLPLPIGIPIAVVGAQCTLEIKGLTAKDQSWTPGGTIDLKDVVFKTYLGDDLSNLDGLVGYLKDTPLAITDSFCLPYRKEEVSPKNEFLKAGQNLDLKMDLTTAFTLLMDPRSVVNISSGILPVARYELPQHAILKPLKQINIRFLAAPVITPVNKLKMPLMQIQDLEWSWLAAVSGDANPKPPILDPNTNDMLNFESVNAVEGWLKLNKKDK